MWGGLPAGSAALQFASYFANSFTLMMAGAVLAFAGLNRFFAKRRSYALFVGYFVLKTVVNASFDAVALLGWESDELQMANALWTSVTAALSYLVIYYTWNATLLKAGVAATFVDVVAGASCEVGVVAARWLSSLPLNGDFYGPFGWQTVFIAVFSIAVGTAVLRMFDPFARWLRVYEFRHQRLWQGCVIALIATLASSRLFTPQLSTHANAVTVAVVAVPLFLGVMAFSVHQMRAARKRRDHLARGRSLLAAYTQAVREQSAYLEDNRAELDALSRDLERLQDLHTRSKLEGYLRDLRAICDELRYGVYSDCPALDAVVTAYDGRFDALGLGLDLRIAPLGERGAYLAPFAHVLLDWAYRVCEERGESPLDSGPESGAAHRDGHVAFRVAQRGNVDILRLDLPYGRGVHFPRYLLQGADPAVRSTVVEQRAGRAMAVLALLEGDATGAVGKSDEGGAESDGWPAEVAEADGMSAEVAEASGKLVGSVSASASNIDASGFGASDAADLRIQGADAV